MSKKTLWSIYGLFLVCGVAQAAIVPLLPRLSSQYGLSPSETGLLLALPGLATLAVSVPAGVLADRIGARRCTIIAGAVLSVACVAQAMPSLALLLVGRALFGLAFGVVWTTGVAWLAEIDAEHGGSRIGPSVTCASVGMMFGPAVGGVLAGAGATGLPFLLIAVASAMVMVPLTLAGAHGLRSGAVAGAPGAADVELTLTVDEETAELARAVGYSETAEMATSFGYSEPVPYGGESSGRRRRRALADTLRQPGVIAATGALVVSGAVSSVSQLLISGGLHHDGLSSGRIGLAFSLAAVSYIVVSTAVVRLGTRVHTLRFNAVATCAMAVVLVPALLSGSATVLIATLMLASMPRAAVSTISYSLASSSSGLNGGSSAKNDGSVFGMVNGAWAGSMVLMPLLAGALEQHGGARVGFLAVIVPATAIALALLARSRPRAVAARASVAG
jgi:MFS family permease